jgi:hypothetical protein
MLVELYENVLRECVIAARPTAATETLALDALGE